MTIKVEIFSSPGCGKCGHARHLLQNMANELEGISYREINILDEMDYAVGLGVLSTPSIAIDGALIYTNLPSAKKLRKDLEQRLAGLQGGQTK